MLVLCCIDTLANGGMQHHMVAIGKELIRRGHSFHILSLRHGPLVSHCDAYSIPYIITPNNTDSACAVLDKEIKSLAPDVIFNAGCELLRVYQCSVPIAEFWWGDLYRGIFSWQRANAIISCSTRTHRLTQIVFPDLRDVLHYVDNPVTVIRSPTLEAVSKTRQTLNIPPDTFLVLSLGRFTTVKRHLRLLHEISPFLHDNQHAHLVIAGSSGKEGADWQSTFSACVEYARRIGLTKQITLLDHQDDPASLLASCDVYVSMSESEGQSLSVSEALCFGKPVICTAVSGTDRQVGTPDEERGILLPVYGPSGLSLHLENLANDPDYRTMLGSNAEQIAVDRFSLKSHIDQLVPLLQSASKGPCHINAESKGYKQTIRLLIITYDGIEKVSPRVRAYLMKKALRSFSVEVTIRHDTETVLADIYANDVVVFHRVGQSLLHVEGRELERRWKSLRFLWESSIRARPTGYDMDDFLFVPESKPHGISHQTVHFLTTATFVIANSQAAASRFGRYSNNVVTIENPVDDQLWNPSLLRRYSDSTAIIWVAGSTHDCDAEHAEGILTRVLTRHRKTRAIILGGPASKLATSNSSRVVQMATVKWHHVPAIMRQADISIAPLINDEENQCKGHGHICEPAMLGIPSVAENSESYSEFITTGDNGILASSTDEWVQGIEALLLDEEHRHAMGRKVHENTISRFSLPAVGRAYREVLDDYT